MVKTVMYHKVKDFAVWKTAFDNFITIRKAAGEMDYASGTLAGQDDVACVINSWPSLEAFQAFVDSDELKKGMADAGVLEKPTVVILNVSDHG
jgi:heme-degrading monooxygenase HmoA